MNVSRSIYNYVSIAVRLGSEVSQKKKEFTHLEETEQLRFTYKVGLILEMRQQRINYIDLTLWVTLNPKKLIL